MKEDHELYNVHLGRGNRLANNEKDAQLKQEEEQQARSSDGISYLDGRFKVDKISGYKVLLNEFKSVGDGEYFKEVVIGRDKNMGKTIYKQEWGKTVIAVRWYTLHYPHPILLLTSNYV